MSSTSTSPPSADEQPKQDIASKVVTPKRQYFFFPEHGQSFLARTASEAEQKLKSFLKGNKPAAKTRSTKTKKAATPPAEPETAAPAAVEVSDD